MKDYRAPGLDLSALSEMSVKYYDDVSKDIDREFKEVTKEKDKNSFNTWRYIDEFVSEGHLARMSLYESRILWVLLKFVNLDTQECFPSTRTIARLSGISRKTVIKYIRKLESKGYIVIKNGHGQRGKKNIYKLNWPLPQRLVEYPW